MDRNNISKGKPIRDGKLIISGKSEMKPVYKINIRDLFYNDENGRISTYMSEYKSNSTQDISDLDIDEYNNIIMKYIIMSESKTNYNKTKNNIKDLGQMEPGIILENGRVIDGNRRFTCLRDLYKEYNDEKYLYFDCYILPVPQNNHDRMTIKSLELSAQYGTDSKVVYNPIDRIADIYKDLVGPNKLFTPEEYVARLNNTENLNSVKKMIAKAETLWEYLEYTGFKGRWDKARDDKLDGPITELSNFRKQLKEEEWDEIKGTFYTSINSMNSGDRTRDIRRLIKAYKHSPSSISKLSEETLELEMKEYEIKNIENEDEKFILKNEAKKAKINIVKEMEKIGTEAGIKTAQQKQLKNIEAISKKIDELDITEIKLTPKDILNRMNMEISNIENKIKWIKEEIKNA